MNKSRSLKLQISRELTILEDLFPRMSEDSSLEVSIAQVSLFTIWRGPKSYEVSGQDALPAEVVKMIFHLDLECLLQVCNKLLGQNAFPTA